MFKKFTAKLCKLADVAVEDFWNLLKWGDSHIDVTNPNTIVCSASVDDEPVAYLTAEPVVVLGQYAFRPQLSDGDAGLAGDAIYSTIEREAKVRGVTKVLITLPDEVPPQPDEKHLRVIELKLPTQQYEQASVPDLRVTDSQSAWLN